MTTEILILATFDSFVTYYKQKLFCYVNLNLRYDITKLKLIDLTLL